MRRRGSLRQWQLWKFLEEALARQPGTGRRIGDKIEILSGLEAGETVIISSIAEFENYDTIQVVD